MDAVRCLVSHGWTDIMGERYGGVEGSPAGSAGGEDCVGGNGRGWGVAPVVQTMRG